MSDKILDRIKEWLNDEVDSPTANDDSVDICIGRQEASLDLLQFIYKMETEEREV